LYIFLSSPMRTMCPAPTSFSLTWSAQCLLSAQYE
jgi:hypothetical protein